MVSRHLWPGGAARGGGAWHWAEKPGIGRRSLALEGSAHQPPSAACLAPSWASSGLLFCCRRRVSELWPRQLLEPNTVGTLSCVCSLQTDVETRQCAHVGAGAARPVLRLRPAGVSPPLAAHPHIWAISRGARSCARDRSCFRVQLFG